MDSHFLTTARAILLAFLLACPGCLAAAVVGGAMVISSDTEADAKQKKARLEFIEKRRSDGATTAQIIEEIRLLDPEWFEEIEEEGGL